ELRCKMNTKLREYSVSYLTVGSRSNRYAGELTGNRRASLRYVEHCYIERVVLTLKYKLVGWPKDIPYRRFGNIPRREQSLRRLLALWDSGELHFEPATAND
ncbi:hypothetical protein C8Q77DRAFT_1040447, partial [Trametes polyzona]